MFEISEREPDTEVSHIKSNNCRHYSDVNVVELLEGVKHGARLWMVDYFSLFDLDATTHLSLELMKGGNNLFSRWKSI